ncbi:MAG: cation:proton antiporter [Casimicrobiaceae bacterium]
MLDIAAACLVITALFSWFNHRFVRLPTTIGVMAIALLVSLLIVGLESAGLSQALRRYEESLVHSIDFSDVLMQGMLSLLLFAGAVHVDLGELEAHWWSVAGLALVGTLLSTLLVDLLLWYLGETQAAGQVMKAIEYVTANSALHTRDLGGNATTAQVTEAVCAKIASSAKARHAA